VSFIDDCTRVTWIFLLKHKSDINTILPNFYSMVKNQFGVNIKRFKLDNARVQGLFQSNPNSILSEGRDSTRVILCQYPTAKRRSIKEKWSHS
jgi:hypothetical protein